MKMSEEAKQARRLYSRAYYAKNREKMQQKQRDYWERKARELAQILRGDNNDCRDTETR